MKTGNSGNLTRSFAALAAAATLASAAAAQGIDVSFPHVQFPSGQTTDSDAPCVPFCPASGATSKLMPLPAVGRPG